MKRSCANALFIISLASSVTASGLAQTTESWRKRPPAPAPVRPFAIPATREVVLANGLTLVMIEDQRAPIVIIEAGIPLRIESRSNPKALMREMALAEATAELLIEGAGRRTSLQLAREVEAMGGRIASAANDDYVNVTAAVVSENAERMVDILADVLLRPAFPIKEITLYKNNRIESLAVERQDPAFLISEQFNRVVYGPHPYSFTSPTTESVRVINRAAVARFYRSHYSPAGAVVVVAGAFDGSKMEAKLRRLLGGWKKTRITASEHRTTNIMPGASRRVYLIDRPGSEQAEFRIGNRAIARSDEDYFPLVVANAVLGDGTGSRLFLNLREMKGYAYDVSSTVSALKRAGTFFGSSQTRTEMTAAAIKEMLAEFDRLRKEKVTNDELQNAKSYLSGLFSLSLSTQGGIADRVIGRHLLGLPADYLESYRARIGAVTADDVQRVARKYLTEDAIIVVAGEAARLRKELSAFGPVEVFDIHGRRIK